MANEHETLVSPDLARQLWAPPGSLEARRVEQSEKQRQIELALEQARYEAARARRQYDAVDPDNRLVAGELERRWDAALAAGGGLGEGLGTPGPQRPGAVDSRERPGLLPMGGGLGGALDLSAG